ncbi:protein XcpP [Pseudomonas sp. NPDC089996]|uniref:protein XcpP n=1 Tax=Pseudomonas sp. NPDC089996 TaxID=3364474 RepID=UPI003819A723
MKRASHLIWMAFVLVTLAWLAWRENVYPVAAHPLVQPSEVAKAAIPEKPLPAATLALAFGFQAAGPRQPSQADIALKASFVSSQGEARALVKSQSGEAIYRVGDRIPDRGVLRRIDVRSIVLWIDGREEVVSLSAPTPSVFLPTGAATRPHHVPDPSSRLLREVQ